VQCLRIAEGWAVALPPAMQTLLYCYAYLLLLLLLLQTHYTNRPRPGLRNALAGVIDG